MGFVEGSISAIWNRLFKARASSGLKIGFSVSDGQISKTQISLPHHLRPEHIAIVGKTGTGKSSLLRYFMSQDISEGRGFVCIDLHGDLIPFVLSAIAYEEQKRHIDLGSRLIYINPNHPKYAVGLNLIGCQDSASPAVQISEMVNVLKAKWQLDHFGARTEELLRNSLWVLCENELTLIEIAPLLTNMAYRLSLLGKVRNKEVKAFFEDRYNRSSEAMQSVMREAVLNKISAFTVDPGIRQIIGQQKSAFSLRDAVDQGFWILLDVRKGSLGENASTFAGLFLTKLKNAIFGRRRRNLFSIYADELPNLVAIDDQFSTLLSEGRKFAVSVVSATQFLNQHSAAMKSALFSVGTLLSFAVSVEDAPFMARAFGGEQTMIQGLKVLRHRHLIANTGERPQELVVPRTRRPNADYADLRERCLRHFAKPREQIEDEINDRQPSNQRRGSLEDWD